MRNAFPDDAIEIRPIVTRRPPMKLKLPLKRVEEAWDGVHGKKVACVICGGEVPLAMHQNLEIDFEAREVRIEGTRHPECFHYGCGTKLRDLHPYGRRANVTPRDFSNLTLAKALVHAIEREAKHGRT